MLFFLYQGPSVLNHTVPHLFCARDSERLYEIPRGPLGCRADGHDHRRPDPRLLHRHTQTHRQVVQRNANLTQKKRKIIINILERTWHKTSVYYLPGKTHREQEVSVRKYQCTIGNQFIQGTRRYYVRIQVLYRILSENTVLNLWCDSPFLPSPHLMTLGEARTVLCCLQAQKAVQHQLIPRCVMEHLAWNGSARTKLQPWTLLGCFTLRFYTQTGLGQPYLMNKKTQIHTVYTHPHLSPLICFWQRFKVRKMCNVHRQ